MKPVLLGLFALLPAAALADAPDVPADFTGPSWVDAAGCAWQRATMNGDTVWAQWLDADKAPICDRTPTALPKVKAKIIARNAKGRNPVFPAPGTYIQVAAFANLANAEKTQRELAANGWGVLRQDWPKWRVVYAGPFPDAAATAAALDKVHAMGFGDALTWTQKPGAN